VLQRHQHLCSRCSANDFHSFAPVADTAKYKLDHEFGRDHLQLAGSFYITHPETNSLAIWLIDPLITMTVMRLTIADVRLSQMRLTALTLLSRAAQVRGHGIWATPSASLR
jgi:hypothetical protein